MGGVLTLSSGEPYRKNTVFVTELSVIVTAPPLNFLIPSIKYLLHLYPLTHFESGFWNSQPRSHMNTTAGLRKHASHLLRICQIQQQIMKPNSEQKESERKSAKGSRSEIGTSVQKRNGLK